MKPIKVVYRGNNGATTPMSLTADVTGVRLAQGRKLISEISWDEVDQFSFEDPKRTRMSVGAVLAFGVLGLGARKNFTFIYYAAGERTGVLEVDGLPVQWRGWVDALLSEAPGAKGKVFIADEVAAQATLDDIPSQIRKLAELHGQGILTNEEFAAKKTELLARM
jgi:hypothetical protein